MEEKKIGGTESYISLNKCVNKSRIPSEKVRGSG